MATPFLFARCFDDDPVAGGPRRGQRPAINGASAPFSFPRLEPASATRPVPAPAAPEPSFSAYGHQPGARRQSLAAQPLADVEAMFRELVVRLEGEPWLEVQVPPEVAEAAQVALSRIAAEVGFQGDLRVLADGGLGSGDARIAWHEGSAARDLALIEAEATALVDAWLRPANAALLAEPEALVPDGARENGFEA